MNKTTPVTPKRLADLICRDDRFAQDAGGRLYRFVGGAYQPRAEEYVKRQVKHVCLSRGAADRWSSRLAAEVVEYIRVDAPELWERPPVNILNVQNGLLQVASRELQEHSPEHLSSVQLPVAYDPTATCPAIRQFVADVFPDDAHSLAWEIPAWLMLPDTSIQKAVLLTGDGANGKSTWLNLVVHFLGRSNTSAVSLHKLEADQFAASRLIGKLANVCPDLPSDHLAGTSVFKALTGGDILTAEYKFRDSFDFVPYARLVFSANHPPRSADSSHAFFRRWVVIPFNRTFSPEEQIPRDVLDRRLTAPQELAGLLNLALDARQRLKRHGGFCEAESLARAWREFYATTDPLSVWLDRYTCDDPTACVPVTTLRAAYAAECERRGRPPISNSAFGRAIRQARPSVQRKRRTINGKLTWCYVGLGFACSPEGDSLTSPT